MKAIYFDVFAGISGDMCLGALVDAGCPPEELKSSLSALQLPAFDLRWERVGRGPMTGTKIHVHVHEEHHVHRQLADVLTITDRISWPGRVREQIEEVYTALAKSEGKIHGKPYDRIHFHEVGSFDAIVDISGTLLAMHLLGVEKHFCSRIHVGEGFVDTHHGLLPLPAPATLDLLQGFDLYSTGRKMETVTPTGAALLNALAVRSTVLPSMTLQSVGYGAGSRDTTDLPNLLRVMIGTLTGGAADWVTVIEANIDDMNPEFYEPLLQRLFDRGALDVTLTPVLMKKQRPGNTLSVIVPPARKEEIAQIVLQESSTIGVRFYDCERRILQREALTVQTPWGPVQGKVCWGHGIDRRFTPEYDSCRRLHDDRNIPIARIYQEAIHAFYRESPVDVTPHSHSKEPAHESHTHSGHEQSHAHDRKQEHDHSHHDHGHFHTHE